MKTTANTHVASPPSLTKNLSFVTVLGLYIVIFLIHAQFAQAAPVPRGDANLNMVQAQTIVTQVYTQVSASHEVAGWEGVMRDRTPYYCAETCGCIANRFSAALRKAGFETRTVTLRKSQGSLGIKMNGPHDANDWMSAQGFDYHMVTIVRALGGWQVIDPIVLRNTRLEPFKIWQKRILTPVTISVQ